MSRLPEVSGGHWMASSTHQLATMAAVRILAVGGNAVDAGVAAGICLGTLERDRTDFGGVAPIMVYEASGRRVSTISGVGRWPRAATLQAVRERYGGDLPPGLPRTVVPAAPDAWLTALDRFGSRSFAEVVQPALELAEDGFPVGSLLAAALEAAAPALAAWPSSAAVFLPEGRAPLVGERLRQPDLAQTFRRLMAAEQHAAERGRHDGLMAARDCFYRGDLAKEMVAFAQEENGFLTADDLAEFHVQLEPAVSTSYRGISVYACGPWSQGPTLPLVLNLVAGFDLQALGHNSADYLHIVAEALKLSFADREAFIGDPEFVKVPMGGLLSPGYAATRRAAIDLRRAWPELPPAGQPWRPASVDGTGITAAPAVIAGRFEQDTSYVCVVDAEGNAFSATPSDPVARAGLGGPLVPGLGFMLSNRGAQSWLDAGHPSVVGPWRRPRLTPNPALALQQDRLLMPFGTPGGDLQVQAMLQVFLNLAEFGMSLQEAIEAPRLFSQSFPNSFWPHVYTPGRLVVEEGIPIAARSELAARGHQIETLPSWSTQAGAVCAIVADPEQGTLVGGADPRRQAFATGW